MNNQTVLQEQTGGSYEPTPEEIREYAVTIGINPDTVKTMTLIWWRIKLSNVKEPHLLKLAREGILSPLPLGWMECTGGNGELYFFNFDTRTTSWEHPIDEIYKRLVIEQR